VIDAVITQPSTGNGFMLMLTWKVVQGEHEGRQIWQYLCYQHPNPTTQDMARKQMKDLCVAAGIVEGVRDPEVFKFKPMLIRVGIKVDKNGQYDDSNMIRRILPLTESDNEGTEAKASNGNKPNGNGVNSGSKTAAPQPSPTKPQPPKSAGGPGAAPWKKGPTA
jgi:hypothetical protein